ncbi:putative coactivator CBP, KIX domain superfamily, mediator complex subunit 15, KIX [Helianthus annuus]|uniref:Coactivator CBP, KIX domain superfamily, mediator complex subunit 15, KIX n=1 Tax=Helianthus annuus TaxID=4232 RepID=A0A9K3NF07_HELAN|nr:mediator of RNA polymerase II transcription subunit 15a isoform X2 [Helianthus annuus]KAF5797929.1 putative coactivator CBP, KIX domain superfamily, mediator complex subunit 15, KIX [Helianthus annuus]KAJ0549602.1 putative coactivator CBP, KIX domain superfamily, mediator complex subunit 15, KIX [Helianthus annuus]KAJ0556051.1 putative coactivator CBP, KIX domain superfamily, mediator complex subunit 15, KIX [Helianthus annuus]KAJ0562557.1 putative coactivator CBP, KIX domain superfamily, me
MDTSNWKGAVDWRTLLPPDSRRKLVDKIMDNLKKQPQFSGPEKLHELKDFALRFEEKYYTAATSQADYMRRISLKLMGIENRSANHMPNSLPSNATCDSGSQGMQQLNNQGIPVPSHHQAGKQILPQSIHNNVSSSGIARSTATQNSSLQNISVTQRQIPASQSSQHYLYQQQIAKQKLLQQNNTTSVQPHVQQQHQNYALMQPTMLQPSSLSTIKQNQQPHLSQQLALRQLRQPQQQQQQQQPRVFGQQNNNLSNAQSIGQHNNFSAIQQHLGHQKQPQSLGAQSTMHSSHLLQSTQGQRSQMELQPQVIPQSAQFQHQLNMNQRLPASFHQQRAMPEASSTSSDSTAQTGNPNSGDCQEEVYQKVKAMKDQYFQGLADLYPKILGRLQQQPNGDQAEKLKKFKHMLERCMKFLQLPKNNISPSHKEKLGALEREIVYLTSSQMRKPGPTLQQRMNSLHQSQMQPHENQMQSVNLQHNSLATLHHNSASTAQQNMMSMLQQQQPSSNMLPHQQLKQLHSRQMQQQLMHKQQLHFHPQTKHSMKLNVNQINDSNELKIKQQTEMKSESLKQLKLDQKNVFNSVTTSSTPLQPANSPFFVSSPSTPSTSNLPGDTDKINSSVSLLANDGNICTPGISASPLLAECTNPDANGAFVHSGKLTTIEQPLERLLKVVKSISPESLSASVRDIDSVVSMIDSIAGTAPGNGSRTAVGEDLVAMTKATTTGKRKMKRFMNNPMFINVVSSASSFNHLENSELESTATSTIKRPRVEMKHPLLEEIREINEGLIDTVVDISQENADPEVGKGTIVKCSYSAVALCPNLKSQYASMQMSPIQPLRLLVPANYPNCSPILLDEFPVEVSKEYEEDLSIKAKWRFNSCVRKLSDPMSLEMMARTWDVCARAVILECVQQTGGGTFTSKYGAWEDCLTAA